jgi:FxLD family lantipeptide
MTASTDRTDGTCAAQDEFELDVQVTTDASVGYTVRRCDTSDNCGSTCGSACASS